MRGRFRNNNDLRTKIQIYTALLLCVSFLCSMLPVSLASSSTGSSGSPHHIFSYIPAHKNVYNVPETEILKSGRKPLKAGTEELPASYRSDEQPWAAGIKIKDQKSSGLCWAFSMTTAAEYSYAKEIYETTGETGVVKETSPGHLGQFFYNRVNDPLGNTEGDANIIIGGEGWPITGGNQLYGFQHLATWSGLGLESDTPVSSIISHIKNGSWDDSYLPYDNSFAYKDYITMQNCEAYFFYSFSDKEILKNTLKDMVYRYGAVSTGVNHEDKFFNLQERKPNRLSTYLGGRSFYNYENPDMYYANHAITIIGWDDNYPASNFTHKIDGMSDDEAYALTTPDMDGAWIIQNSWGTDYNDNGVFYASYETADFQPGINADAYAFDMQPADTYRYNFQYDGSSDCGDTSDPGNEAFFTRKNSKAANVYTNSTGNPILLEAVGFTAFNNGLTNYKIEVYTGLSNATDPTSGSLACTTNCSTTTAGAKTAELGSAVQIKPGETFSIVFTFNGDTYFGVEKHRDNQYTDFRVQTDAGQSFFCNAYSTRWTDINRYDACFRIKGLANDDAASMPTAAPTATPTTSPSPTPTATPTASPGPTPTSTPTATPSPTPTSTPTATPSPTPTSTPTATPGPTPTATPTSNPAATPTTVVEPGATPTADPANPGNPAPTASPNGTTTPAPSLNDPTNGKTDPSVADKIENTLKVKGRLAKIRYKKLVKKSKKLARMKVLTITGANASGSSGRLTYKLISVSKNNVSKKVSKNLKKYFRINKNTGTFTVKKKLGKGLYKVKVSVSSAGNSDYNGTVKNATIKIRVR